VTAALPHDQLFPLPTKSRLRTKSHVPVEIFLSDGQQLGGYLFLANGERVLDLLNDSRPFLPFRQDDADMLLINKTSILACRPLDTTTS